MGMNEILKAPIPIPIPIHTLTPMTLHIPLLLLPLTAHTILDHSCHLGNLLI